MDKKFCWKHITFSDGSNPYICKTEADFNRMKKKYHLEQISGDFWEAKVKPEPDLFKVEVMEDDE